MSTRQTRLPGLGSVPTQPGDIPRWLDGVKETLEVWKGARGDKFDSVVTWRDLASLGMVTGDFAGIQAGTSLPTGQTGGVLIRNGNGTYVQVSIDEFAEKIRSTPLYRDLNKRLDDPTRFDALPERVRNILLTDIAAEAQKRGADIRRIETKIQSTAESFAATVDEITAAVDGAVAGVRTTAFAYAEPGRAAAGIATQVQVRLNDVNSSGVTIEQLLYGVASGDDGLLGQYTLKIDAGGALAGFGLSVTNKDGVADSAFLIRADRFAIVSPTYSGGITTSPGANFIPFGVDSSGVFINGQVRINSTSNTLDSLVNGTGVNLVSSSEFWKVDSSGAAVNSTITLTASLTGGLTGTVTWTASTGWTGTPPTGTNTWTVNAADQTADAVTYTATKVDGSNTYVDSFTLVRLRDGSDSLVAILTNPAHGVPALQDGSGASFTDAVGQMRVYRGTTLLTSGVTYSVQSNPAGLTTSIDSSGNYAVTAVGSWPNATKTALITYRATIGSVTRDVVFSVTKNLQGLQGASAAGIVAQPASLVFRIAKDGTATPSSIVVGTVLQGVSGTITWTTPDNTLHVLHNQTGSSKTIYPLTSSPNPTLGSATSLKITVSAGGYSDTFTIVKVFEGTDAVSMVLSNEAHSLPSNESGGAVNYTGASCTATVYVGAVDDSANWTYTTTSGGGLTFSGASTRTVTVTSMSVDVSFIDITATKGSTTITRRFSLSKAKQGTAGGAGAPGLRGSISLYKVVAVGTWSDLTATNTILQALGLTQDGNTANLRIGDQVTQSNPSWTPPFASTKYWSGFGWTAPGVVLDGNLIASGTVSAAALATTQALISSGTYTVGFGATNNGTWGTTTDGIFVKRNSGSAAALRIDATGGFGPAAYMTGTDRVLQVQGPASGSAGQTTVDISSGGNSTALTVTAGAARQAGPLAQILALNGFQTDLALQITAARNVTRMTANNGGAGGATLTIDGNNEVGLAMQATYTEAALRVINLGTGFGITAAGNATRAPIRMVPLSALPTDRTLGSFCVLTDTNPYFANGAHWFRITGLQQMT